MRVLFLLFSIFILLPGKPVFAGFVHPGLATQKAQKPHLGAENSTTPEIARFKTQKTRYSCRVQTACSSFLVSGISCDPTGYKPDPKTEWLNNHLAQQPIHPSQTNFGRDMMMFSAGAAMSLAAAPVISLIGAESSALIGGIFLLGRIKDGSPITRDEVFMAAGGFAAAGASAAIGSASRSSCSAAALIPEEATLGRAATNNYRQTFFEAFPETKNKVVVHHAVEQQALRRYPGVASEAEIHSLQNLRGIPIELNSDLHLSVIRREWNRFYKLNPDATLQQLLNKATEIDQKFGHFFNPPK